MNHIGTQTVTRIVISQTKFTIYEFATQEEWLVLPENWQHEDFDVEDHRVYFSDKNFVAIEIETDDSFLLLILNLASRKRYWFEIDSLEEKIIAKITDIDGEQLNPVGEPEIRQMKVQTNQIEMKYHIRHVHYTYDNFGEVGIG